MGRALVITEGINAELLVGLPITDWLGRVGWEVRGCTCAIVREMMAVISSR